MGKARIYGSKAVISVVKTDGTAEPIGEVDKFTAKKIDELKKSQPLGEFLPTANVIHQGWDLTFEGGKVDWNMAALIHAQDLQIQLGGRSPYFTCQQVITYFNGTVETYQYNDVSIHGYEIDIAGSNEEITEKFAGFSRTRVMNANTDKTILSAVTSAAADIVLALAKQPESPISFIPKA
jgi:hypothetical protein